MPPCIPGTAAFLAVDAPHEVTTFAGLAWVLAWTLAYIDRYKSRNWEHELQADRQYL